MPQQKIRVISEQQYPPEAQTPSQRFEYLGHRAFQVDPDILRQRLEAEKVQREQDNPGPTKKRGRRPLRKENS